MGGLQLGGVQSFAALPDVVEQGAVWQAVFQLSHASRFATQSELGSQWPGGVGSL